MPLPSDIIAALPLLRWRGLVAPPYDLVTGEWKNHLAGRRIPYVAGELHDDTGRGSFPMTARLYFCNGLQGGPPGIDLFPAYWEQWREQLLDGKAGDLDHPVLGSLRARVDGAKFELRATVRSGIVVDVSWVETVEDPTLYNIAGSDTDYPVAGLAATADDMAAAWEIYPGDGLPLEVLTARYGVTFEAGETHTTLTDIFNAIRPSLFAGTIGAVNLITSLMGDVAAMVDALMANDSVHTYAAYDALTAFYLACANMRAGLNRGARPTGVIVVDRATTLDAVARTPRVAACNSLKDVMGLNLSLLKRPALAPGTPVTYYLAA